jgi:uncharacterized membrane-anchored protein
LRHKHDDFAVLADSERETDWSGSDAVMVAISIPIVALLVALGIRRIHQRVAAKPDT